MTLNNSYFAFQLALDAVLITTVAISALIGAIIGSFLNVVIHRLPREESIVFPNSRCPACNAPIRFYDNIPVLSYLILRGRCRQCGALISPRYPAVEVLTGLVFALVAYMSGLSLSLPFDLLFAASLVALVFIDAEHMILPNAITYPGAALALIVRLFVHNFEGVGMLFSAHAAPPEWMMSFAGAILGAIVGGGSLWLTGFLWKRLRGVDAMGLGDVKMMLMVGAYLGWPRTVLTIFLAVVTGSIAGIVLMVRRGERDMTMMLPFGIFLGIGALVSLLYGSRIIAWYVGQFAY
ncbi:MAG: prepilin peptidase [Pyrinomonadaceae bacterium]|nr:prepilin peptidase [Pyrinomonadaceae bacterium]